MDLLLAKCALIVELLMDNYQQWENSASFRNGHFPHTEFLNLLWHSFGFNVKKKWDACRVRLIQYFTSWVCVLQNVGLVEAVSQKTRSLLGLAL